jgi:hypothetical protein
MVSILYSSPSLNSPKKNAQIKKQVNPLFEKSGLKFGTHQDDSFEMMHRSQKSSEILMAPDKAKPLALKFKGDTNPTEPMHMEDYLRAGFLPPDTPTPSIIPETQYTFPSIIPETQYSLQSFEDDWDAPDDNNDHDYAGTSSQARSAAVVYNPPEEYPNLEAYHSHYPHWIPASNQEHEQSRADRYVGDPDSFIPTPTAPSPQHVSQETRGTFAKRLAKAWSKLEPHATRSHQKEVDTIESEMTSWYNHTAYNEVKREASQILKNKKEKQKRKK